LSYRFLFLIVCVVWQSCSPSAVVIKPSRISTSDITVAEIFQKNNQLVQKIRYVKSVATLTLESPKSSNQFSAQIALKLPDSVYIKIEGFLGVDGLKASLNKETFIVYNIINKYVIRGKTSSAAIRKTFDYDVSFEDMTELLTGLFRLKEEDFPNLVSYATEDNYYLFTFGDSSGVKKIWVDPSVGFAVVRVNYYNNSNQLILEKEFSRFEQIDDYFLPRYVRVLRPSEKDLLSFYFDSRTVNRPFKSNVFIVNYPKDIKIIEQ